jgi:hypothetical protein
MICAADVTVAGKVIACGAAAAHVDREQATKRMALHLDARHARPAYRMPGSRYCSIRCDEGPNQLASCPNRSQDLPNQLASCPDRSRHLPNQLASCPNRSQDLPINSRD